VVCDVGGSDDGVVLKKNEGGDGQQLGRFPRRLQKTSPVFCPIVKKPTIQSPVFFVVVKKPVWSRGDFSEISFSSLDRAITHPPLLCHTPLLAQISFHPC